VVIINARPLSGRGISFRSFLFFSLREIDKKNGKRNIEERYEREEEREMEAERPKGRDTR
jgi:hypothetical protein